MRLLLLTLALVLASAAADPRLQSTARPRAARHWARGARTLADRAPTQFVGPHVCRSRNSTHCCPGWTSRPNSLLCLVPICRPDCGGGTGSCVAPNMCRCPGGVEAPSCGGAGGFYPHPARTRGGCRRICMNGGTCANSTCACAPGWSGEFCTEPICREPCLHGGRCIAPDRCVCFHGLSGTRCEIDRRTGPCYTDTRGALCTGALEGVVCTKQLCCATVGVAWGHPCERCADLDCPPGHLRNLQTKECQDIDECLAVPGLCEGGKCVNSVGSFSCECAPGQRRHRLTNNCEDIDECEDPDICPNGKCVNTEGDYYCLCNPHFIPSPDKKFCMDGRVSSCFTYLGESGECADRLPMPLSNRDCCCGYNMGRAWGELCAPCPPRGAAEWSHLCGGGLVPPDWRRNDTHGIGGGGGGGGGAGLDAQPIAKINECMLRSGICGLGNCIDKDIGYQCECWDGAESAEQDGNPTCIDIDECALQYCKGGVCVNKPGGFECRCPPGFDPVENGLRCSDKNECEMTNGGMCTNGVCVSVGDGFSCECSPGYAASAAGHACRDVDECADNPRVCRRGRCRNTPGGYHCACEPGFARSAAGYCADVDECAEPARCAGGRCANSEGSYQCVCEAGYRADAARAACADVDECAELRVCRNGRCHNAPGSFRCECLPGFTLSNDGRTCLDEVQDLCYEKFEEDQCSGPSATPVTRSQCCCSASKGLNLGWGVSCKACPPPGSDEYAALCPSGAGKDNGGADINECTQVPGVCPHGTCENLEPGYRCLCDAGYRPDAAGICRDVDECDMHQSYCTGGQCRNTPGSFECVCPAGTRLDAADHVCRDVDECAGEPPYYADDAFQRGDIPPGPPGWAPSEQANPCDNGRCINTHGSYECECEHGFVLDPTAQHCLDNRRGSCWRRVVDGKCEAAAPATLLRQECCCSVGLAWGSPCEPCEPEHCPCAKGFAKLDGATCRDVDECMLDPELCIGGQCVNTDGSYRCDCPPGLTLDATGNRCMDTRREQCYAEYAGGRCAGALAAVRRAVCCCSALGRAWGDARCEPCPKRGTDAHRDLCVADATGPAAWGRPGAGGGNRTDIWGGGGDMGGGLGEWDVDSHSLWGNDTGLGVLPGVGGPALVPGQMEVNECAAFPGLCGPGRCKNMLGTFTCECFPGYEKDSKNHTCVDVNECEIVDEVCGAGECRNTEGSFTCRCNAGYTNDDLSKVCVDVNECAENPSLCRGGRCVNAPGSFRCECAPGMELAPDRLSCKDVDECSITSGICSNGACENLMGTYQCVCDEGYAQSTVKSHCEDIDECADDPTRCQHDCVNTPGSYHCTCKDGWHLRADGRTCRDVDECAAGARVCGGGACRNTPGAYLCECGEGLLPAPDGKPTCLDVDECQDIPDLCGAGECRNTIGSFVCRCSDGYSVKPEQGPACTDDDECELGTCDCHPAADCINLPGSFQCRCRDGWRGDGAECEDVDECLTNNGGCHPRAACRNADGSYACLCDTGYRGDGYACADIDECANDPTLCENGHCGNAPGGYECECDVGFAKAADGKSCLDMDECATFDNVCVFGRCVNTYGMFKCICDKGFQSDSVDDLMPGFNCTDVDECKSPQSCQYGTCVNTQGSYICRCPPNYELVSDGTACFDSRKARCYSKVDLRSGTEQCRDSDELSEDGTMAACCCSVGAAWGNYCDLCPEPGSEAYRQLCPGGPGYQPVLEPPSYVVTLADIDECAQHAALCAHGTCTNTFGSFVCTCGAGWALAGERCEDVDECARDVCGPGVCRNLPGSYVCLCPEGYVAMPNGKECVDVRQRQCYMEWDAELEQCAAAVGVPQTKYLCCCSVGRAWGAPCEACPDKGSPEHIALCGEKPGEYINPMTNETKPIDECDIMPQLCKPGTCHDTPTGFQCGCDHGYEHDNTSHLCRDVDECSWRPAVCRGLAQCANAPGGYECRCPPGYRLGAAADECEDVDECADRRLCEHGDCRNTVGSYRCECKPGYTLRDGACRDVDECSRPRPLCRNGTCENVPGSYVCHCDEGFKPGANNDCIDVNECREGGVVCRNGRCRNTAGSFRCECSGGYALDADARNCRDVDECAELPAPCGPDGAPVCTNTNGGYECACGPGWRLAGRRCVDRDECRELQHVCAGGECHNFNGGYRCDCPSGWRFDEAAAVCVDERKELCYDEWDAGRCHKARPLQLSRSECCCSEGAAWGRYCSHCPSPSSAEFLRVCQGGMGRPNLTQDLDECRVRPSLCRGGRCVNTDGSYRCECPPGYVLDATGDACVDADECAADPRLCGNGTCTNTPGGYECRCNAGFTQGPEQTCVDIDECKEGRAMCSFRCHNTPGSFRCTCPFGYRLAPDGVHCRDVDECADTAHPVCRHACENVVGSYVCKCPEGYRRTAAPHDAPDACEDVDECAARDAGAGEARCAPGVCINTDGGFLCDCDAGYEPSEDGRACIDRRTGQCHRSLVAGQCVPEPWPRAPASTPAPPTQLTKAQCCCTLGVAWGPECELCPAPGSPERIQLCVRSPLIPGGGIGGGVIGGGMIGGGDSSLLPDIYGDVDECAAMPELCAPGRCVNTIGSFRCVCGRGYKAAGDVCLDVDECLARPGPCDQLCRNTDGSYQCVCRVGYELDEDGANCRDVDECARGSHTCQQTCTNTEGSFECDCNEGYEKRGDACVDINECHEEGLCPPPGKCVNLLGSYRCVCPRGFRLDLSSTRCLDRDECAEGLCQAPCRNRAGGYRCECPPGSARAPDGGCTPTDACAPAPCGAAPCFPLGGAYRCGCPAGYGWDAAHAVCLQLAGGCAAASCLFGCQALGDSYQCGCPSGYQLVGAGHCLTALDGALAPDDIGAAPVFPLQDQYRLGGTDLISTEGCFSCKMNGRRRRTPEEGIIYANGTTIVRKRRRRSRRRRSLLEPEAELIVVTATPKQTWGRAPLLRLLPASDTGRAHYRVAYGDPAGDFVLSRRDGTWALRLRRHLRKDQTLEKQLELEARVVTPGAGRSRRHAVDAPPPLRLYVSVRVAPHVQPPSRSTRD